MATFQYAYIHAFKDRHGKQRYYFRRQGQKRIAIIGTPGSSEFHTAYQAALAGISAPKRVIGEARTAPGTMRALIVAYYQSGDFLALSAATKTTYRGIIDRIREEHGDKPVKLLGPKHVLAMQDQRASTPSAANTYVRMIRMLMRFAIVRSWRDDDPTIAVRKIKTRSEGFRSWTDADIARFKDRWPQGTRAHLALYLLIYTGQRRSDVVRMGKQHISGGSIHVQQQKTKSRLAIPIHARLQQALDTVEGDNLTFLLTQQGKGFSPAGFTNWFVECAKEAGLPPGSTPHGLRKAAARKLAEAGCTPHQIMAITGHRNLKEVTHYTAAVSQVTLAEQAMRSLK
jgi:integrase